MKKTIKLSLSAILACGLFIGCSSDDDTATILPQYTTQNTTNTGYFIDAAVNGAHYKTTSGLEGTTDQFGRFSYNTGDEVELSLGKIILGTTTPGTDGLVTPKTLISDNLTPDENQSASILLMLRMLQSLDNDGNATNGITIDSNIIDDLEKLAEEIDFQNDIDEDYLIQLDNSFDLGLDEDYDGVLDVNETEAKDHFEQSQEDFEKGYKPEVTGSLNSQEHTEFDLSQYPVTLNLSDTVKNSLAYMGNEERLAYDVYNYIYEYQLNIGEEIKPFTNIASKSEIKHIGIVKDLVVRYDINDTELSVVDVTSDIPNIDSNITLVAGVYNIQKIQDLYNTLITIGQGTKEDALKVGCMVEVVDVNDLDTYIQDANTSGAEDVLAGFEVLRDGSYKHYWAFDKTLKNMGVENGCYYEGDELLTNKEGIYPKEEENSSSEEHEKKPEGAGEEGEKVQNQENGKGNGSGQQKGKNK